LLGKFNNEIEDFGTQNFNNDPSIIPETQLIQSNTINITNNHELRHFNNLNINQTSMVNINDLFDQFRLIAREEISKNKPDQNNSNSLPKKLTTQSLKDLREIIFRKYEKQLKVENIIALFKTHKDNNTLPNAISYKKFPRPLWGDDQTFVDTHNSIIKLAQNQIIEAILDHGKILIDCINVELIQLKSELDICYNGNKEKFFENIKLAAQSSLKNFFDASNAKLLRLQNNYFEDHVTTEYEIVDYLKDDYIINYVQLNNQIDDNTKQHNNENSHKKKKVNKQHDSYQSNYQYDNYRSNNHNQNNYNNRKSNYKKNDSFNNNTINENWRSNMTSNYQQQQQQQKQNDKQQQNKNNSNLNFQLAPNQNQQR
jgi:hypothetical protein